MGRSQEVACFYGKTSDISIPQHLGSIRKVPGDGACFWHSIAHAGKEASEWTEQMGSEMKHTLLAYVRNNAEQVGRLLAGSSQVASAILHDWHAWDAWTDGRAPPLITACFGVSVMILNARDQCVELFAPVAQHSEVGEIWVLRLDQDHFDYLQVDDVITLNHVLEQCPLKPLLAHDTRPSLRGGAIVSEQNHFKGLPDDSAKGWAGAPSSMQNQRHGQCYSINIGGLRTSLQPVLTSLQGGGIMLCVFRRPVSNSRIRGL